jgi:methionyl-tRNA synthetase
MSRRWKIWSFPLRFHHCGSLSAERINTLMRQLLGYLQKIRKRKELQSVMYHLAESLRITAVLLQPFLTQTPEKIFAQLGVTDESLKSWDSIQSFRPAEICDSTKRRTIVPAFRGGRRSRLHQRKMQGTAPKEEPKKKKKHLNGFRNHD